MIQIVYYVQHPSEENTRQHAWPARPRKPGPVRLWLYRPSPHNIQRGLSKTSAHILSIKCCAAAQTATVTRARCTKRNLEHADAICKAQQQNLQTKDTFS